MKTPTPDDYRRAAEVIKERGWHQGNFVNPDDGSVCLLGAIYCARAERLGIKTPFDKGGDPRRSIHFEIPFSLRADVFDGYGDTADWNDARGRTEREVTTKLRRLAKASA